MCGCASDTGTGGGGNFDPGADGTEQDFRYVATGAEPNPFPVTFPTPRPNTDYNVYVQMGGPVANAIKDARALVASFTLVGFQIELGAGVQAGDIFMISVRQLT